MARTSDPTYISGSAPHLKIQPPILHPAWCVCRRCSALPEEERGEAHTFRIYRASKFPMSERDSIIHAFEVKRDLERELAAACRGVHAQARAVMSLREVCDLYFRMNPKKVSAATIERDQISAGNICRLIGDGLRPDQIDEPVAVRYRNAREEEGVSPRTTWNELSFLKMVLRFGLRWQRETGMLAVLLDALPDVGDVDPDGVALSLEEIGRILDAAKPRERRIIITGITTMLRRRPLMAMQRPWVDLERGWLSVPATFNKKGRARRRVPIELPLCAWTADVLREAPVSPNGFYWSNSRVDAPISRVFQILDPLATAAKVRPFSMHDLRTTGATLLRQADVDELVIALLLGHRSSFDSASETFHARGPNVTRGYTKLFESTLRESLGVFDDARRMLGL